MKGVKGKRNLFALVLIFSFILISVSFSSAQLISTGSEQSLFSGALNLAVKSPGILLNIQPLIYPSPYSGYGGSSGLTSYNSVTYAVNQVNPNPVPLCSGSTYCGGYPTAEGCLVTNPFSGVQYSSSTSCSNLPANSNGSCTTDGLNIGCTTASNSAYQQWLDQNPQYQPSQDPYPEFVCSGTALCQSSQCDRTSSSPSHYCEYNQTISCNSITSSTTCTNLGCTLSTTPNTGATFSGCTGSFCSYYPVNYCMVTIPNGLYNGGTQYNSLDCGYLPTNSDGSCTTDGLNIGCTTSPGLYDQCMGQCQGTDPIACGCSGYTQYSCTGTATCPVSQCDRTSTTPSHYCSPDASISCSDFTSSSSCLAAGCVLNNCSSITNENTCATTPGCVNTCQGPTCSSGQTRTFTCSGTYQTVDYTSGGSCVGITNGGASCDTLYFSQSSCLSAASNGQDCHWFATSTPYNATVNCSGLSESDCYKFNSCTPSVTCTNPTTVPCTDSDSGSANVYVVQGTVDSNGALSKDVCINSTYLREYSCSAYGAAVGTPYNCGSNLQDICSGGACVTVSPTCSDTDGSPTNYKTQGTVTTSDANQNRIAPLTDYCNSSSILVEYGCNSFNASEANLYNCSTMGSGYTCKSGACVNTTTPTPTPSANLTCQQCTTNADCASGLSCVPELGSSISVCMPQGSCAKANTSNSSACSIPAGNTTCNPSKVSIMSCNGTTSTWQQQTNCSATSQVCASPPSKCIDATPSLYWVNSKNQVVFSLKGAPGSQNAMINLYVNYATKALSYFINISGIVANHSIGEVAPTFSQSSYSSNYLWNITSTNLSSVGSDHQTMPYQQYNIYYAYGGQNSPTLNYSYDNEHCGNQVCEPITYGETNVGANCQQDCSALEWANASASYDSINTVTWNFSQFSISPLVLSGYLFSASSANVPFNFTDYPASKPSANRFITNQKGTIVEYNGSLATNISITKGLLDSWRTKGGTKSSVVSTNPDGSMNEKFILEVSSNGNSKNLTLNILNTPECTIYGNCTNLTKNTSIQYCSDYNTKSTCINDPVGIDAAKPNTYCSWNSTFNLCQEVTKRIAPNGVSVGTCTYSQQTETDTCNSTGFLTYSWNSTWKWDPNNNYTKAAALDSYGNVNPGYFQIGTTDFYRYDPNNDFQKCQPGKSIVPCPARVELNFISFKNIVAAIVLILIIYLIIAKREKKKKELEKKKSTKKKGVKRKAAKKK